MCYVHSFTSIYMDRRACASLYWWHHTFNLINGSDRGHVFCHNPSLQDARWTLITHIPGRHLALPLWLLWDWLQQRCVVLGTKTNRGLDVQTVTYCRLSSLSLPSSVVSLFLPWGGDGRFLQGKSNNLSHHQTSLHLEKKKKNRSRTIQAIFLVVARKIVRGRLVSVVMHYRWQVVHGTGEVVDLGWCSSFSSTS